jgi:hypothetical protein
VQNSPSDVNPLKPAARRRLSHFIHLLSTLFPHLFLKILAFETCPQTVVHIPIPGSRSGRHRCLTAGQGRCTADRELSRRQGMLK